MEPLRKKPAGQSIEPDWPQLEKARCIDPLFILLQACRGGMSGNFRENSQKERRRTRSTRSACLAASRGQLDGYY